MAVEPYLERCHLLPSGPQGAVEMLLHLNDPVRTRVRKLHSGEYYLRFVNDPLIDSDLWVWWGGMLAAAVAAGWFISGLVGVEIAAFFALLVAFIMYIQASPIRLRFFPAAFVAVFFFALESLPIWFFLHTYDFISVQVEYLILLPIYLVAL